MTYRGGDDDRFGRGASGANARRRGRRAPRGPRVWSMPDDIDGNGEAGPTSPTDTPPRQRPERRSQHRDDQGLGVGQLLSESSSSENLGEAEGSSVHTRGGRRKRRWRTGVPPFAPVWESSWIYEYCVRFPLTFEDWNRVYIGWKYRIAKYMPAREASLLLYDAIKYTDVRKELRAISMDDIMSDRGLDVICDVLSNAFKERKNTHPVSDAHIRARAP